MLFARRHLMEALLVGILVAVIASWAFGLLTPAQLLRVEPDSFGATGLVVDGFQRGVGVSVFTLLLMALVGTLQATDLLERLVRAATGNARSARGAEAWIVATVSGAVLLTTQSVVAVLVTGPFAKATGKRFGLSAYRRANLLDLTVCTWPCHGSCRRSSLPARRPGPPRSVCRPVGAAVAGMHNTYAWALVVMIAMAIWTGYGREGAFQGGAS